MKKIIKKNQVIITALAIMLAIAGYLSFSEKNSDLVKNDLSSVNNTVSDINDGSDVASNDLSEEDLAENQGAIGNSDDAEISAPVQDTIEPDNQDQIGETVLTNSTNLADYIIQVKLEREQVHSKSKDMLMDIINNTNVSESEKADAIAQVQELVDNMDKEVDAEAMLGAKGYSEAVVSISGSTVDVTVNAESLDDVSKAQIEDIVARKTGCSVDEIVIYTIKLSE